MGAVVISQAGFISDMPFACDSLREMADPCMAVSCEIFLFGPGFSTIPLWWTDKGDTGPAGSFTQAAAASLWLTLLAE